MWEEICLLPRIDDRDWSVLTSGERIRQIEVEGYLLIPDLLTPEHLARLKAITDSLETHPSGLQRSPAGAE